MKYWNDCARVAGLVLIAVPRPLLASEEAEGGGAALFDVNLGLSLWTVVVFVLLLVVLGKFAWGPILEVARPENSVSRAHWTKPRSCRRRPRLCSRSIEPSLHRADVRYRTS